MKKRVISLLLLLCVLTASVLCAALQLSQRELSGKLIRLHVVADSDSRTDQEVKLRVRDAVLGETKQLLAGADDPRAALAGGLDRIGLAAERCLRRNGSADTVRVTLGKELFPTRTYDTFSLPAGVYESLRVTIGAGRGHNWWCVIFPSICMTASMDELTQAAQTAGFTDGEIRLITEANSSFVLKFKTLELFQKLKNILLGA